MRKDYIKIILTYLTAGAAAYLVGSLVGGWDPVFVVAAADLVGTLVIFGFSLYYDNSSFYDAYWSLAPVLIAVYWLASGTPLSGGFLR